MSRSVFLPSNGRDTPVCFCLYAILVSSVLEFNSDFAFVAEESDSGTSHTGYHVKSATKRLLGLSLRDTASSGTHRQAAKARLRTRSLSRDSSGSRASLRPLSSVSTLSAASSSSTLGGDLRPALTPSLFPHVPPTINFVEAGEKGED